MAQSRYNPPLGAERRNRSCLRKKKQQLQQVTAQLSEAGALMDDKPLINVDKRRQMLGSLDQCHMEAESDLELAKTDMDGLLSDIDTVDRKLSLFSEMVARRAEGLRLSALEKEVKKNTRQLNNWCNLNGIDLHVSLNSSRNFQTYFVSNLFITSAKFFD